MVYQTTFQKQILHQVHELGGWLNAHAHLDRADTFGAEFFANYGIDPTNVSSLPLKVKQHLTGELHKGKAYTPESLHERMSEVLEAMIDLHVKRVDSFIDTTDDNVRMIALDEALELKEQYKDKIDFRVGAYNIFGFKRDSPQRWELFKEACKKADYIGTLPERDELDDHIGFEASLMKTLKLALDYHKPIHIHLDQMNSPHENGTETLVDSLKWFKAMYDDVPEVSAVHVISPSCYDDERFYKLVDGLLEHHVNIICCPTAAVGMKQLRDNLVPTHNSIARVCEMAEKGIKVTLGTDNISDAFMPAGHPDPYFQVLALAEATRMYHPRVLAKIATGTKLNESDKEEIRGSLYKR